MKTCAIGIEMKKSQLKIESKSNANESEIQLPKIVSTALC